MATDTLYLTNSNLKFEPVSKDRLFFDLYRYCMSVRLPEASCLRKLDHAHIDYVIGLRKFWLSSKHNRAFGNIECVSTITEKTMQDLYAICDVLSSTTLNHRHVVSANSLRVYTNDLVLLTDLLTAHPGLEMQVFTEAVVDRVKDTIALKNPKHKHRSYFNRLKLTDAEKRTISNLLVNWHDDIRLSPCLIDWITQPFKWVEPYYFIDHDEEAWLVMLSLVRPGLIKKTISIIKA